MLEACVGRFGRTTISNVSCNHMMAGQEFHRLQGYHTLSYARPVNCSFAKAIEAGLSWPECLDVDDTWILRQNIWMETVREV